MRKMARAPRRPLPLAERRGLPVWRSLILRVTTNDATVALAGRDGLLTDGFSESAVWTRA